MNILHIWDQAGVACIFAKYQNRLGHKSKVIRIINDKNPDKYGIYQFYNEFMITVCDEKEFLARCLKESESADVIHVHSQFGMVVKLRQKFGMKKIIVLEYLGTDIRGLDRLDDKKKYTETIPYLLYQSAICKIRKKSLPKKIYHIVSQLLSDQVLVGTPDLLAYVNNAKYIPLPLDTEHFNAKNKEFQTKDSLTFNTETSNIAQTIQYCKDNNVNLDLEIHDRTSSPISYNDMPSFLKKYKKYIDIRFVNKLLLKNLSTTAIQALGCGLKVLDYNLNWIDTIPNENIPENIIPKLFSLYNKNKKKNWISTILLNLIKKNQL